MSSLASRADDVDVFALAPTGAVRRAPLGQGLRYAYLRRVVGTALGAMGLERAERLARWLAGGLWELGGPARQRAEQHVQAAWTLLVGAEQASHPNEPRASARAVFHRGKSCPDLPDRDPPALVRACYENIACFWVETLFAPRRLRASNWHRRVRLENGPGLRPLCNRPGPAVFVTDYVGHPGVGAFALGQLCRPLHVLVDVLAHPVLRAWQADIYRQPNLRLIPRHTSLSMLTDVLESGGKVMLIGEQPRPGHRGDAVEFLGREMRIYQTVRILSRRYGAPVIPFACFRTDAAFSFTIRHTDPIGPAAADISQQTMTALQSLILSHPEQYLWTLPD